MPRTTHNRSEEVNEIIGKTPHWMVRWGTGIVLIAISILLIISYVLKYPDTIECAVVLNTQTPSQIFVSKLDGRIHSISHQENDFINQGDQLLELESSLDSAAIVSLMDIKQKIDSYFHNPSAIPHLDYTHINFGELQTNYNRLKKSFEELSFLDQNHFQAKKIIHLKQRISRYKDLESSTKKKRYARQKQYDNAKKNLKEHTRLYKENVITRVEFDAIEDAFSNASVAFQNTQSELSQLHITIGQLKQEMLNQDEIAQRSILTINQAIHSDFGEIKAYLKEWSTQFQMVSSISGRLKFLKNIGVYSNIKVGDRVLAIIPDSSPIVAYLEYGSSGAGKVSVGQKVFIKLNDYPSHEFGQIEAKVTAISGALEEGTYRAEVHLPKTLITDYKKELIFRPGMIGEAKIITKDVRIIQRIFGQLLKALE